MENQPSTLPTSFTDLFSGNSIFQFEEMNPSAFQYIGNNTTTTDSNPLFNAAVQLSMDGQQEVLLSNILSPPMEGEEEDSTSLPGSPVSPGIPSASTTTSTTRKKTNVSQRVREWKLVSCSEDLKHLFNEDTVKIAIKTRDDKQANYYVPDKLYSSLRYVLTQKLDSSFLSNKQTVLMSKIQIVNPQSQEEIRKKNNEYVIDKGNTMVELKFNADTKCYECTEKIKFLDNSYRHNDIKFAFKVSFYDASQPAFLTKSPILELLSAPFHVRARRPPKNKRDEDDEVESPLTKQPLHHTVKKTLKRNLGEDIVVAEDNKKAKLTIKKPDVSVDNDSMPSPTSSKRILSLLEKLAFSINSLPEHEKDSALELARKKLGTIETLKKPIPFDLFPIPSGIFAQQQQQTSDADANNAYAADELFSFEKFL